MTGGALQRGVRRAGLMFSAFAAVCAGSAAARAASIQPGCEAGSWDILNLPDLPEARYQTDHFALRWKNNDVSMDQAAGAGATLELVWNTYMTPSDPKSQYKVGFTEPYCDSATKYKVNVHIDPAFALTGGPIGDRDMGMWIGPGALLDRWGLAHEFARALQGSTRGLRDSSYAGWMWESHANWMTHQLQENRGDAHCSEMLVNYPHLYLGSTRNRYCNWQFFEYLKDKYGYKTVNDIWTRSKKPGEPGWLEEDPFSILARNMNWTAAQLNDAVGEWALRNVNWDYKNPDGSDQGYHYRHAYGSYNSTAGDRALRVTKLDPLNLEARQFAVPQAWAPQRWGYNIVRLIADSGAASIQVSFRGVVQRAPAATSFAGLPNEPQSVPNPDSGWRWGLAAIESTGRVRYSALQRGPDADLSFDLKPGDRIYMVVVGAPAAIHKIQWEQPYYSIYRFPWMAGFKGAWPEGFQPGSGGLAGGHKHANGGGWVAAGANVASTAYVGPYARVLGGTVSDQARIEDHAVILNGAVSGQAVVGGLTVLQGGTVVRDKARVATTFKGPGAFEQGVTISGTAQVLGDVELRGVSLSKGVYYGFIDEGVKNGAGSRLTAPVKEVTAPVTYAWRP